jgi:hypothetical protein
VDAADWSGGQLATFVVTQAAAEALELGGREAARRKERAFALLLVSGLTLFALAVNGYHPYAEDGGLYMAGAKRLLDPALYPYGTGFVLEPTRYSLFARAVAGLVRATHVGLPVVLLGLDVASVWVTLFAAWMLATRCWEGSAARAGAVTLLACWLGLPVAGTALLMMDPYVTARSFSTPCMVLALAGALDMTAGEGARRRGMVLWGGSIALAVAMHPLMAAYALGASLMLMCLRAQSTRVRVWGTAGLCVAALGLAGVLCAVARPESADYARVALTRSYWFLAEWRWYEVVGLVAPLGILGWYGWWISVLRPTHRDETAMDGAPGPLRLDTHISEARCGAPQLVDGEEARQTLARMAVAAGATAVLVAMMFARAGGATHLVARMQPLRVFQIVYLVMALLLGAWIGERVLRRKAWRWVIALALLGGTMFAASRAAYPDSRHVEAPWAEAQNPWVRAFLWIRANTPKDALFALDADYINAAGEDAQCFRAIAERSALADYSKDGGEASIAPALTEEWVREQAAQRGLSALGAQQLSGLRSLGVSWVVLDTGVATGFECPYRNEAVEVCQLR